jgi:hypothetical protein
MPSSNIKYEASSEIHVKSESFYIDIMASPKQHFKKIFEDEYSDTDKLKVVVFNCYFIKYHLFVQRKQCSLCIRENLRSVTFLTRVKPRSSKLKTCCFFVRTDRSSLELHFFYW